MTTTKISKRGVYDQLGYKLRKQKMDKENQILTSLQIDLQALEKDLSTRRLKVKTLKKRIQETKGRINSLKSH